MKRSNFIAAIVGLFSLPFFKSNAIVETDKDALRILNAIIEKYGPIKDHARISFNKFVCSLKRDGIWDKLEIVNIPFETKEGFKPLNIWLHRENAIS